MYTTVYVSTFFYIYIYLFLILNFSHGTKVTGLVAAEANNNRCIVGVAHKSTIIGKENGSVEYKDLFSPKYLSYKT